MRIIFIAIILLSISSCNSITYKLWHSKSYEDNFRHFLINGKFGYIVFLTPKFHYVFNDNSNLLKNILTWQDRRVLYIDTENSKLILDDNNKLEGEILIRSFSNNLMPNREQFLFNNGFLQDKEGWYLKIRIYGERFLASNNFSGLLPQLDLNYKMKIIAKNNNLDKVKFASITPLTLGADGIILIGKILLFPFRD